MEKHSGGNMILTRSIAQWITWFTDFVTYLCSHFQRKIELNIEKNSNKKTLFRKFLDQGELPTIFFLLRMHFLISYIPTACYH